MLSGLHGRKGSQNSKKRVGRGVGSGRGKTSSRGHKGQNARRGRGAFVGFEGGQMPLYMRLPQRGFVNYTRKEFCIFNLSDLQKFIESGHLDKKNIKVTDLAKVLNRKSKERYKLLGNGECKIDVNIEVHAASKPAIEKLKASGGTVTLAS